MEFHFCLFSLLLIILPIIVLTLQRRKSSKLPTGPTKLPLIGNIHQIFGSLPHEALRNLAKKHGPLMHLKLGEISHIVISSPEIAREVLKAHDMDFAQRSPFLAPKIISYDCTNIVFSPYGGYWRQLRKICTMELLSSKRVQSFRSMREQEVSNLVKSISLHEGSEINLSKMILSSTYGITSRTAFGEKYEDQEVVVEAIMEVSKLAAGFSVTDLFPSIKVIQLISGLRRKLEKEHYRLDGILQRIIDDHRNRNNNKAEEDLVDVLLRVQKSGDLEYPLSDDHLKAVILDVFGAGSESSSTTVDWTMSELMKNPKIMQKAQSEVRQAFKDQGNVDETKIHELKFLKSVIKESLRLHPPLPLIPRECCNKTEIFGYEIALKTKIYVNTWAINRDQEYWSEPDKFNPDRFLGSPVDYKGADFEFIPFGTGRRICPGISFALASIELPLAKLLYHFDWKLPNGMEPEDMDMTESYGLTVRRKAHLFLIPHVVNPQNILFF